MTCSRCGMTVDEDEPHCPHCGEPIPGASGVFQSSTVLISAAGADLVYRSVEEVPAGLRTQLLKSTNGVNSATILIADRRGRQEIAKTMRNLPGPAQRRLLRSMGMGDEASPSPLGWLTPGRKKALLVLVVLLTVIVIAFVFTHRW